MGILQEISKLHFWYGLNLNSDAQSPNEVFMSTGINYDDPGYGWIFKIRKIFPYYKHNVRLPEGASLVESAEYKLSRELYLTISRIYKNESSPYFHVSVANRFNSPGDSIIWSSSDITDLVIDKRVLCCRSLEGLVIITKQGVFS